MKEMVLKIPRLDDKVIAQYTTTSKVNNTPKSSGRARGRPRKNVNKQLISVVNIEEPPNKSFDANTSLKDFRSNVNDLLQVEEIEIELSPPKKARNSKTGKNVNKQLQDDDVDDDEDFSPMGKTRSAKKTSTPKSTPKYAPKSAPKSTPKSAPKSTPKSHSKIVNLVDIQENVNKQNPIVDLGQRIQQNVNKQENLNKRYPIVDLGQRIQQNVNKQENVNKPKKPSKILHDATTNKSLNIFLQCRFCDEFYEKESNLKNHVLNHFKEKLLPFIPMSKPYQCPECNQISRDRITLLRHFAFAHKAVLKFATEEDFKARISNSKAAVLPITEALEPVVQID